MDRRIFLRWLGIGAASATAYAFMPSIPLIGEEASVLPVAGGNILVTPEWVTQEVTRAFLTNHAIFQGRSIYEWSKA